jgi:hypothetical protein
MSDITVHAPDGSTIHFPASMAPTDIEAAMQHLQTQGAFGGAKPTAAPVAPIGMPAAAPMLPAARPMVAAPTSAPPMPVAPPQPDYTPAMLLGLNVANATAQSALSGLGPGADAAAADQGPMLQRQQFIARRDPAFEQNVSDYNARFLGDGNTSIPRQILNRALSLPVAQADQAIPPTLSEVGKVAILRAVTAQNGTNLRGLPAVQSSAAALGVPLTLGTTPAGKQGLVPNTGGLPIPQYLAQKQVTQGQQQSAARQQLLDNRALYLPTSGEEAGRAVQAQAVPYDEDPAITAILNNRNLTPVQRAAAINAYNSAHPTTPPVPKTMQNASGQTLPLLTPEQYQQQTAGAPSGFDATVGAATARVLHHLVPGSSTNPAFDNIIDKLPLSQAIAAQPEAQSGADFVFPGSSAVAAQTPGALGAARQFALGFTSPENLAILGATVGAGGLAELLGNTAAAGAQSADLLRAAVASRIADEVNQAATAGRSVEDVVNTLRSDQGFMDAAKAAQVYDRVTPMVQHAADVLHLGNRAGGLYFSGQGAMGAAGAAADLDTAQRDPAAYAARLGLNSLLAVAPFAGEAAGRFGDWQANGYRPSSAFDTGGSGPTMDAEFTRPTAPFTYAPAAAPGYSEGYGRNLLPAPPSAPEGPTPTSPVTPSAPTPTGRSQPMRTTANATVPATEAGQSVAPTLLQPTTPTPVGTPPVATTGGQQTGMPEGPRETVDVGTNHLPTLKSMAAMINEQYPNAGARVDTVRGKSIITASAGFDQEQPAPGLGPVSQAVADVGAVGQDLQPTVEEIHAAAQRVLEVENAQGITHTPADGQGVGVAGTGSESGAAGAGTDTDAALQQQRGRDPLAGTTGAEGGLSGGSGSASTEQPAVIPSQTSTMYTPPGASGTMDAPIDMRAAVPSPGSIAYLRPDQIAMDPERFQYKLNTNDKGVTNEFRDTHVWNPDLAGVVSVWHDPADGKVYAINGHHRTELSQRLGVPGIAARFLDAPNATEARTIGAMTNIAEGRGTAIDAAKLFRDTGADPQTLAKQGVSLRGKVASDGLALSRLADPLFRQVALGQMPVSRGVAIGSATPDPAQQGNLVKLIEHAERRGKRLTDSEISELGRFVSSAPNVTQSGFDLFGDEQTTNTAIEKAQLSSYVKNRLAQDKRDFGAVSKAGRAQNLGRAGNVINTEENARIATEAAQAGELYDRLSGYAGPVSDALNAAAIAVAKGGNVNHVREQLYNTVRQHLAEANPGRNIEGGEGVQHDVGAGAIQAGTRRGPNRKGDGHVTLARIEPDAGANRGAIPEGEGTRLRIADDGRSRRLNRGGQNQGTPRPVLGPRAYSRIEAARWRPGDKPLATLRALISPAMIEQIRSGEWSGLPLSQAIDMAHLDKALDLPVRMSDTLPAHAALRTFEDGTPFEYAIGRDRNATPEGTGYILLHELRHAIQAFSGVDMRYDPALSYADQPLEHDADAFAQSVSGLGAPRYADHPDFWTAEEIDEGFPAHSLPLGSMLGRERAAAAGYEYPEQQAHALYQPGTNLMKVPEVIRNAPQDARNAAIANLSHLGRLSQPATIAARRVAGSTAEANTIMRNAWPQVVRALGPFTTGGQRTQAGDTFRAALVESRLRGIQGQWRAFADEVRTLPDADLMTRFADTYHDVLDTMRGKQSGRYNAAVTEANDRANYATNSGDVAPLRGFLHLLFQDAARQVATHFVPGGWFDSLVDPATGQFRDPKFQAALKVYKSQIERPLRENHELNAGVLSSNLGPLDTYYPLTATDAAGQAIPRTSGAAAVMARPQNSHNAIATGLSEHYGTDLESFADTLKRAIRTNNRAALVETLTNNGLAVAQLPGQHADVITINGVDMPAVSLPASAQKQTVVNGKTMSVHTDRVLVPADIAPELRLLLEPAGRPRATLFSLAAGIVGKVGMQGLLDASAHSANLLGGLVMKTPFIAVKLMGGHGSVQTLVNGSATTIGNLPPVKIMTALIETIRAAATTGSEEAGRELGELARLGVLPEKAMGETYSKDFAEQTGAHRSFNLGPLLHGPHGVDPGARLVMYRTGKQMLGIDGPIYGADGQLAITDAQADDLYHMVAALGQYHRELMGNLERGAKESNLAPFATAGNTFLRNGINAWLGGGRLPSAGIPLPKRAAYRLANLLTGGALGLIAFWMLAYRAYRGKWPHQDPDSQFLKVPLSDHDAATPLARALFGSGPGPHQVNFAFYSPGVTRGPIFTTVRDAYDLGRAGATSGQMAEHMEADALNQLGHPVTSSPLLQGIAAFYGVEPSLSGLRDKQGNFGPQLYRAFGDKPAQGEDTLKERTLEGLLGINGFARTIAATQGIGKGRKQQQAEPDRNAILKMVVDLAAPRLLAGPASQQKTQEQLRRESMAVRRGLHTH